MLRIFQNLDRKERLFIGFAVVFIVLQVWLDLKLPDYMSEITVLVESEGSKLGEVLSAGGRMLLCAFGSLACAVAVSLASAKIGTGFAATLREKLFHQVQEFHHRFALYFGRNSQVQKNADINGRFEPCDAGKSDRSSRCARLQCRSVSGGQI